MRSFNDNEDAVAALEGKLSYGGVRLRHFQEAIPPDNAIRELLSHLGIGQQTQM